MLRIEEENGSWQVSRLWPEGERVNLHLKCKFSSPLLYDLISAPGSVSAMASPPSNGRCQSTPCKSMINALLPARPSTENWVPVDTTTPGEGVSEHAVHTVITVAHT